ncbi:MAG: hypothetical protein Q9M18_07070 [Mariprofundaceae bacterium]|nr:hypothetical protein [Mariprofundaceae bacterium]
MNNDFTYEQYRHDFASWSAARAAQRGFEGATVGVLKQAIEDVGLDVFVNTASNYEMTEAAFDVQHQQWCTKIRAFLLAKDVVKATYGLAAKLVNVYLKSAVILGERGKSQLASVIHPPIDGLLLKAIAKNGKKDGISPELRKLCVDSRWTRFDGNAYRGLIVAMKAEKLHKPHFWMLERYWPVSITEK